MSEQEYTIGVEIIPGVAVGNIQSWLADLIVLLGLGGGEVK